MLDARRLGHQNGHEWRGEHRHPPGGDVGADPTHRHLLLSEPDPREGFGLEVGERGALAAGEAADLLLCQRDRGPQLRRASVGGITDLRLGDLERVRRPAVELLREGAHGVHPVALDRHQHLGNASDDRGIAGRRRLDLRCLDEGEVKPGQTGGTQGGVSRVHGRVGSKGIGSSHSS